jgi:hypothetical protein
LVIIVIFTRSLFSSSSLPIPRSLPATLLTGLSVTPSHLDCNHFRYPIDLGACS